MLNSLSKLTYYSNLKHTTPRMKFFSIRNVLLLVAFVAPGD